EVPVHVVAADRVGLHRGAAPGLAPPRRVDPKAHPAPSGVALDAADDPGEGDEVDAVELAARLRNRRHRDLLSLEARVARPGLRPGGLQHALLSRLLCGQLSDGAIFATRSAAAGSRSESAPVNRGCVIPEPRYVHRIPWRCTVANVSRSAAESWRPVAL